MKKVLIGGGHGFWGDSDEAAIHMVKNAEVDYLACDYLAELTLSIMERQKLRNPKAGYAMDFLELMNDIIVDGYKNNVRILADAGGMNVKTCVNELTKLAETKRLHGYKIGYVLGDDIKDQIPKMLSEGIKFENIDGIGDFSEIQRKIVNANVYYGHEPIVECLKRGANVVVTGRATDSTLFLSPLVYEFDWSDNDWQNLARGLVVGHLLECGGQGSGGNYDYDWRGVPHPEKLGYPIAEVSDNEIIITKSKNMGGVVCEESVKEQILYEIHDPANYLTPDAIVDVSHAKLTEVGKDRVRVDGVRGKPRPEQLKLNIGYHAGYKVINYINYSWPDAYEKAKYAAEILIKKMKHKNLEVEEIHISYLGLNSLHLDVANMDPELVKNINEVILRFAIRTKEKEEAEKIIPEIAPMILNGPPGASFFGGRAKVIDIIGLWPTLIPRDAVNLTSNIMEVKNV